MKKLTMLFLLTAVTWVSHAKPLDPLVPVALGFDQPSVLAGDLKRMRDEFGFRRFVLVAPFFARNLGRADLACYERNARDIAAVKDALKGTDIQIGWWCCPTFRASPKEPFQRILDCDGNAADAICPLDKAHAADFAKKLCAGLRIAHPDPIFIEDDFTLSNHGGLNAMRGCFCPLHMRAYAAKVGRAYTPKEVAEMFRRPTAANLPLRQAWADAARESLVSFAAYVRGEIDKVAPETRVCQCQSGCVDIDGDTTEAVARAWAGKTRPFARIFGAGYFVENSPLDVPVALAHLFWSAQHLPPDIEMIHETDAYPHTRFYNSSLFLISEFAGALMAGVHDSYYYCLQYTDDALSDTGYAARFRSFARRFETVRDFRQQAKPVGVRMVYAPKEVYLVRESKANLLTGMLPSSTLFLTKLGFPMTTREDAPVATLFGPTAKVLTDDEIRALLRGGLFLDGEAAEVLTKRGFADQIGVEARDDVETRLEFLEERIQPPAGSTFRGRGVFYPRFKEKPTLGWTPAHTVFAELKPKQGAVVWSDYRDLDGKSVAPAVTYFENSLGGRVGVMAPSASERPPTISLYTPRKQELFQRLFRKLSNDALAVSAPKTPNTFVLAAEKGDELLVMVNNLAGEPRDDVKLAFSPRWAAGRIERLQADGTWRPLEAKHVFGPLVPEFLRVTAGGR